MGPLQLVAWGFYTLLLVYTMFLLARLVFDWPDHHGQGTNRVTFTFDEFAPNRTRVNVTETGWQPTPEGLQSAYGNVMGWSYMLAAMRVWLDHGIAMRPGMFR